MSLPLSSSEAVWERLEQAGEDQVFQRIDEHHPGNFYAALDARRRRGLVLISSKPPSEIPDLENLEIEVTQQQDGRWRTCIWVAHRDLQNLFASLVQDILDASRSLPEDAMAQFTAARIVRWRDLLECGSSKLALWELRGLVAELVVLKKLCDLMTPAEVVEAWHGPLGAPQDFVFQQLRIEVKAVGPTARRIRITSAAQLDTTAGVELRLVAVLLASTILEAGDGFTVADLVADIRSILAAHAAADKEFSRRLGAAGAGDLEAYHNFRFRLDGIRNFAVQESFPRIVRSMLMDGIDEVSYSIAFAKIASYERALGD